MFPGIVIYFTPTVPSLQAEQAECPGIVRKPEISVVTRDEVSRTT